MPMQKSQDSQTKESILSETGGVSNRRRSWNERDPAADRAKTLQDRARRLKALSEKLPAHAYKQIASTPTLYLGRRLKASLHECSALNAIRAKCEECVGYEETVPRVANCRAFGCPIHAYRPYQQKAEA